MTFDQILSGLKKGEFRPVYFFHGNEPFYTDTLSKYIEDHVLEEGQRAFNQTILYGKETDARTVMDVAARYPMMAERQVVVLKEAQEMRDLKNLQPYIEKPVASTMLVICHKHKRFNTRSKFGQVLKKHAVVLESKKLYDNQVAGWIRNYLKERGYTIDDQAAELVGEYLGTELSKVANELNKLMLNLEKGARVGLEQVQEHIGISKDYNVFELQKALAFRQVEKVNRIVFYLADNMKNHPLVFLLGSMYTYFAKVRLLHDLRNVPDKEMLSALKLPSPFFLKEYRQAARNYPVRKLRHIFRLLKEYDLRSKGLNNNSFSEEELLKELVYRILHEPPI